MVLQQPFLLLVGLFAALTQILAGPVNVRIETDGNQDFHIGPEPRTRFELVEQYSPLATAKQVHQGQSARAFASSLNKIRQPIRPPQRKPVQVIVDFGEAGREGGGGDESSDEQQIGHPHQLEATTSAEAKQQQQLGGPKLTITRSQWLEWTKWGRCDQGKRMRFRKCLKINRVPCEGPSEERQKCYSAHSSHIKFAEDPNIIEREIIVG